MRILPAGDQALTVELSNEVDDATNRRVIALAENLAARSVDGITETVPTYRSLLVCYDPAIVRASALADTLAERLASLDVEHTPSRQWTVPVFYGGAAGMDLEELADMKGLGVDEVISLHSGAEYRVYMIGFAPGFAYLGGLPEVLHTPRLTTPRQHIVAGSIGIGGKQASINSLAGPSGWRFIGRTPLQLFDPQREEPALFRAGDTVRFEPVNEAEFERLEARVAAGETIVEPVLP
ncbi:5-oxoprolinase subunit PxpB [Rhizobium sp. PAMB 3182]